MVCLTSSVLILSVISCDRFSGIMFPLRVRALKKRTSFAMFIVWSISIVVSIPLLIVKKHTIIQINGALEARCKEDWPLDSYWDTDSQTCVDYFQYQKAYYLTIAIILYFLPLFIMVLAYSLILYKLWVTEVPGEYNDRNINVQNRARKKVIKMVFVVLLAFIICWTPFQIIILMYIFPGDWREPFWFKEFKWSAYFLAYTNSFFNPLIYGCLNKSFRDGFCTIFKCKFKRTGINRSLQSRSTLTSRLSSSLFRFKSRIIGSVRNIHV